jgi:hypothetical protein
MKMRKTLQLMEKYRILLEQDGAMPVEGDPAAAAAPDPNAAVEPAPSQQQPFTSESENKYLKLMVLAAKYKPTVQDDSMLDDLLTKLDDSNVQNKRAEVLLPLSELISAPLAEDELRDNLDAID